MQAKEANFGGKGAARMMKGDDEEDERVQVAPNMAHTLRPHQTRRKKKQQRKSGMSQERSSAS